MIEIGFSPEIVQAAPGLRVIAIEADIDNGPTSDALWHALCGKCAELRQSIAIDQVNKLPGIQPTRVAYKACGKEPNRYRPSAEALARRAVKGMELYRTLAAIDLINLISLSTGHSIGGFDADKAQGPRLELGVGREGEPFEAIGRGPLNIAGLPAYRDALGAIGTPTSDCERTKLTPQTKRLLMLVNVYDAASDIDELERYCVGLLEKHAGAKNINSKKLFANEI
ncbi:MAG: phenylalanine--tRNA ligase beta subunit-related protein [Clostridium sp.]|nr:phenylalanine--tRNA ligase beta subunit-related protein [Clostridium sp.]